MMEPSSTATVPGSGFHWFAAEAYVFDIDGTLLNSRDGVHYNAFHSAMRTFFRIASSIDGVPVHGNTDPGIIRAVLRREGVSDQDFDQVWPRFAEHMCAEVERNRSGLRPELCPSVTDLITVLRGAGKLLGVASGNLERIAWAKLEAAGLRPYFAFGSFSDQREKREDIFRHAIEEARRLLNHPGAVVFMVGDTPSDIVAARAVGAPIIAIATGIFSLAELAMHGPDTCVACCADLLACR